MNLDRKNKNNNPYLFFTNFQLNFSILLIMNLGFRGGSVTKNLPANAGDSGLIPGSERSPGVGNDNPLQYSCLGNPWRGIWWATIYGVAKSRAWLSNRARRHADLICRWGNEWGKEWMDVDGSMTLAITFFEALLTKMSPLRSVTQDRFPFSWSWGHGLWRWEISKWRQSTFLLEILHWAGESKG